MAATADKYSTQTLNDKDTVSGQTTTKNILALMPLALSAYKQDPDDSSEDDDVSDASFCQKFFCHDVWHMKDADGNNCVMGLLDTRSGISNAYYQDLHQDGSETGKASRYGKLRLNKGGVNYVVLNDGGLNTKAFIDFTAGTGTSPIIMATPDFLAFNIAYQNAYYANTTKFQITINAGANGTRTFTMQGVSTLAKSASELFTYLGTEIAAMALPENTSITLQMDAINPEGTYTSTVLDNITIGRRETRWQIYLVENETDDWDDGTMYYIILDEDWWDYDPQDADPAHNLGWLLAQSADPNTHVAEDTTIRGQQGSNIGSDILSGVLPAGMYLNIPDGYIETPTQEDPPGSSNIIWINSDGHPYKWKAKTTPTPTPVVYTTTWASTNPVVIGISLSGNHTSYATAADGLNDRTAYIYPSLTLTCADSGAALVKVRCSVVDHYDYSTILASQTKDLDVVFTANNQTKVIDIAEDPGAETTYNLPVFELLFTPTQGISRYDVVFEVTETDPDLPGSDSPSFEFPSAVGQIESDGTITTT